MANELIQVTEVIGELTIFMRDTYANNLQVGLGGNFGYRNTLYKG